MKTVYLATPYGPDPPGFSAAGPSEGAACGPFPTGCAGGKHTLPPRKFDRPYPNSVFFKENSR